MAENNAALTQEELAAVSKKSKDFSDYMRRLAAAEKSKQSAAAQASAMEKSQQYKDTLEDVLLGSSYGNAGTMTAREDLYGRNLAAMLLTQLDAGIDIYADPENQKYIQMAAALGYRLPQVDGLDYNRFVTDYQDELYRQDMREKYGGWNFGYDPETQAQELPKGMDEETLRRMAAALGVMTPEDAEAYRAENPGLPNNGSFINALNRYTESLREQAQAQPMETGARNGTPGLLSDEYEDIDTRVDNLYEGGTTTEAGQAYLDRMQAALNGEADMTSTPTSRLVNTALGFGNTQGSGSARANPGTDAGTPGAGRGIEGYTQQSAHPVGPNLSGYANDAKKAMLDALVRGSGGGMATTAGFGAANAVLDSAKMKTPAMQAYKQYANYEGNPLKRDRDYDYLNRLLTGRNR